MHRLYRDTLPGLGNLVTFAVENLLLVLNDNPNTTFLVQGIPEFVLCTCTTTPSTGGKPSYLIYIYQSPNFKKKLKKIGKTLPAAVSAVEELQREKQAVRSSVEALSGQLRVARKHVDRLRSDSQRKRQELAVCRRGAKEVVRASLNDLTRYIFPIKEHSPPPRWA